MQKFKIRKIIIILNKGYWSKKQIVTQIKYINHDECVEDDQWEPKETPKKIVGVAWLNLVITWATSKKIGEKYQGRNNLVNCSENIQHQKWHWICSNNHARPVRWREK